MCCERRLLRTDCGRDGGESTPGRYGAFRPRWVRLHLSPSRRIGSSTTEEQPQPGVHPVTEGDVGFDSHPVRGVLKSTVTSYLKLTRGRPAAFLFRARLSPPSWTDSLNGKASNVVDEVMRPTASQGQQSRRPPRRLCRFDSCSVLCEVLKMAVTSTSGVETARRRYSPSLPCHEEVC